MNWLLFLALLGWSALPSFLLLADRILDVPSRDVIKRAGPAVAAGSVGLLTVVGFVDGRYLELVLWGAWAGLLGTIALDVVRLVGVKAKAFPLDMPVVFGHLVLGRARILQANIMGQVLSGAVRQGRIKDFLSPRIGRIPWLTPRQQANATAATRAALTTLEDDVRDHVGEAQFAILSSLPSDERRAVMAAMDAGAALSAPGQPRGLPRVPFQEFREGAKAGIGRLRRDDPTGFGWARFWGYVWHFLNGISFGVGYALLFGQGSWGWAVAWGVFVWLAMMLAMPAMMPMLQFPAWFPIVPFVAHLAMIVPYGGLMVWVSDAADKASLLGWLLG